MMSEKVKLRPHHILCIKHYEGKGYSEEFNIRMKEVIAHLDRGERFKLVCGADDLCEACPNCRGGVCSAEQKVKRYDKAVTDLLGISYDKEYSKDELFARSEKEIYEKGRFDSVCSDCEWAKICHGKA